MKTYEFNYWSKKCLGIGTGTVGSIEGIEAKDSALGGLAGFGGLVTINAETGHTLWSSRPREVIEAQ